jgi:hypothetical protein
VIIIRGKMAVNWEGNDCGLSKYYTRFYLENQSKIVKNLRILGVWPENQTWNLSSLRAVFGIFKSEANIKF